MGTEAFLEFEGAPLYFDVVTQEVTEHRAEVTSHPVEEGVNVSDHVRSEPDSISLEIMVSNTPVKDVNQLYDGQIAGLELKVPKFEQAPALTPGSLVNAGLNALGSLLNPPEPVKAIVLQFPERFDNVAFILGSLIDWKDRGIIGRVITPHRTYPSVVITRVAMTRTSTTGEGATIALELKQIRLVESKLIDAPDPAIEMGKKMVAKGRQPTSFVRDEEAKRNSSTWHKLKHRR